MNGIHKSLDITICKDPSDSIRQGFFYRPPVFKPIQIEKVVIVKNGMQSGKSSVDFVMVNEDGQKYACLLTADLVRMIVNLDCDVS